MNLYVIRRPSGWRTPEQLQAAAARSKQVGDEEMSSDIRWIRSYVVHESDGGLGTFCVYQASSPRRSASTRNEPASLRRTSSRSPTRCSSVRIPSPWPPRSVERRLRRTPEPPLHTP